jgi:16S rRNA (cytosine1402-N4)-methyltransferase
MPVMVKETMGYLLTDLSGTYVDCTLGAGGHAAAILQSLNREGELIGIDRDERAIANFQRQLKRWPSRVILLHSRYALLGELLKNQDVVQVDGVLFDLGLASFQIDEPERGFSYLRDGPLDMRMDSNQKITAEFVVNAYDERTLGEVVRDYGEERHWRRVARAIVRARKHGPIESTLQLADIITGVIPKPQVIKSLSRCFQALRVHINRELDELRAGLDAAVSFLKPGSRLVVICYQSLEDRVVKELFAMHSGICQCPKDLPQCICGAQKVLQVLNRRAIRPSAKEIEDNPRARSARLRVAQKISPGGAK